MEEEKITLNNPVLENIYIAESSLLQKPASHNYGCKLMTVAENAGGVNYLSR